MFIENILRESTAQVIQNIYNYKIDLSSIRVEDCRHGLDADFAIIVFPFVKFAQKKPFEIRMEIGHHLTELQQHVSDGPFPIESIATSTGGFLNIKFSDHFWMNQLETISQDEKYGFAKDEKGIVVLEYIGPNTNKPLHLGHIRNMFLGYSMAEILKANGHQVHKVNIYNDRGIAICKSMAAWLETADGATPESTGIKGDHFVGKYYVGFNQLHDTQKAELLAGGMNEKAAEKETAIYKKAEALLLDWEARKPEVIELWETMNNWVYTGFQTTFSTLGIDYEKAYFESDHYKSGKVMVQEGLKKGVFFQKEDGSIWVDNTDVKLDEKLLLRSNGTSVYITQDLSVAESRYQDYNMEKSIYVVGDEQDYHFKVLKATLQKLGRPFADGIYHLSYGMVDLPDGKMKSREGKAVDADDLIKEMLATAASYTNEQGKTEGLSDEEAQELYKTVGFGALKYFILKVQAKSRMLFNPKESIDFIGHTGPFIQYTHARIHSLGQKFTELHGDLSPDYSAISYLEPTEKELLFKLYKFELAISEAGKNYDPSEVANYAYFLAKSFNRLYADLPILKNDSANTDALRISLAKATARIIKQAMGLLGINVPNRM